MIDDIDNAVELQNSIAEIKRRPKFYYSVSMDLLT